MTKKSIYLLGLLTLIAFPLVGLAVLYFVSDIKPLSIFTWSDYEPFLIICGLLFGVVFAKLSMWIFNRPFFDGELTKQKSMILNLNLTFWDKVFLSFCAGFGEEILFRAGMQHYVGIWITSVVFIAIHGYLNPKKPKLALYGLFLIPFIVDLGFFYEKFGLWMPVAAHFSYDLVLFMSMKKEEEEVFFRKKTTI
jgi:hypothetical protein